MGPQRTRRGNNRVIGAHDLVALLASELSDLTVSEVGALLPCGANRYTETWAIALDDDGELKSTVEIIGILRKRPEGMGDTQRNGSGQGVWS